MEDYQRSETSTSLASYSSCDPGMDTLQKAKYLTSFQTNYHGDQQHYSDNDHDINEHSSTETDFDQENGLTHKVITTDGSAPHQMDTTGTVKTLFARDASGSMVDLSPTKSNDSIYNHLGTLEFPNCNVVDVF
ncbi:hypothetical protein BGZ90_009639 [Linnemannia elongata]|nr:hypothetical protein BGZ90_009639 [Linnemannia elongata]